MEIFAIDKQGNVIQHFKTFEDADKWWIENRRTRFRILYKGSEFVSVQTYKQNDMIFDD